MATIHTNFVTGTLSQAVGASDTVLNGAGFAALDVVAGTDIAKIILDPFGEVGPPEIVYITGHTANATTVTGCQRGREDTNPRTHQQGVLFAHAPVASDWKELPNAVDNVVNNPGSAVATGTPVAVVAGGNNVEGTSTALARSDHQHQLATDAPSPSTPGVVVAEGSSAKVARADHVHAREPFYSTTPAAIGGPTGSPGISNTVARGDHVHPFTSGSLNSRNAFGTAIRPVAMNDGTSDIIVGDLAVFDRALHRWTGSVWAPITPCASHVISMSSELASGWTGAGGGLPGPTRYRVGQEVVLAGCVGHGDFGTSITTLPANWRPTGTRKYQVACTGPILGLGLAFTAALSIFTDGRVFMEEPPLGSFISTLSVSLDGIRFLTNSDYS